jgi:tartrate-resistant acid phosphatase type 5
MIARSAIAAALLIGAGGCVGCAGASQFTVRHGAALDPPAPAAAAATGGLRVLHLGDFGDGTPQQAAVAGAAAARHTRSPFALALFAGDLIYECGPDPERPGAEACAFAADGNTVATPPGGLPDPAFDRLHEAPLAGLLAGAPVRTVLALGNHDVYSRFTCGATGLSADQTARRKACLSVAHASPLWSLPARHYLVDQGPARFVVLDSNTAYADYGGFTFDAELAFLAKALEGCERRACFVLLHHPPATAGEHVEDFKKPERVARMARLEELAGGRVRAWLAGHDHDLQHLRTASGVDVLVSGNGARARPAERFERTANGGTLLFASTAWGLGVLTVHDGGWDYRFEDVAGVPLHCCSASGAGRCEPVACRPGVPTGR